MTKEVYNKDYLEKTKLIDNGDGTFSPLVVTKIQDSSELFQSFSQGKITGQELVVENYDGESPGTVHTLWSTNKSCIIQFLTIGSNSGDISYRLNLTDYHGDSNRLEAFRPWRGSSASRQLTIDDLKDLYPPLEGSFELSNDPYWNIIRDSHARKAISLKNEVTPLYAPNGFSIGFWSPSDVEEHDDNNIRVATKFSVLYME